MGSAVVRFTSRRTRLVLDSADTWERRQAFDGEALEVAPVVEDHPEQVVVLAGHVVNLEDLGHRRHRVAEAIDLGAVVRPEPDANEAKKVEPAASGSRSAT